MDEFISGRKKFRLKDATLLRRGEDRRHSFVLEQVLTEGDDTMNGMPEFICVAYNTMIKSANRQKRMVFEERFENVAFEAFPTFKGRRAFPIVIGAQLYGFIMERIGKGEDADVVLRFVVLFSSTKQVHDWTYDHKRADFWAQFEEQQGNLLSGEEMPANGDGEDVDDEDEEEDEDGVDEE